MYRGSSPSRNTHQADRSARAIHPLFICLIGIGTLQPTIVVFAAERCPATNATKVVSVQGKVTWSVISNATLNAAKLNDLLCVGDTVRVGAKSRAVLRLPNETTIPLDQNTIFQLKEAISEKDPTLIELLQGAIHIITRTPKPFKVNTPYLNAVVEGTEFYVGVDSDEARVAVIEGKVNVSNEQGAVLLIDNEAATARKGQAPQKTLTIKPRDAVQWALYYPPLFDPRSRSGGQNLSASHDLYSQGKITEAIESLDAIPEAERNGDYYSYRAGLLLLVGRADEAEPDIETALRENGNNTDALSLKAIIAIVRNDKAKALELANQAVNIHDKSASARIALSYALQANFKIEDALKAARDATLRDADNALAWARVAELELSIPNYSKSKEAAEKAVKLNPNLARTQSVLGFANLAHIDIQAAQRSFSKAIELDQADPAPRLGRGLAMIREGNLSQGREEIEIAVALDPESSLLRSYLGKSYYEEKRNELAEDQFKLAKVRDPKDPTPYFYDAIRKQTTNRPVEAIEDLENSIELNDKRVVFRSRFLLDEDRASRGAGLAALYQKVDFKHLALAVASESLSLDPSNYSTHRFLASAYSELPRHEIGRVSELLQASLLAPSAAEASVVRLSTTNLNIVQSFGSQPGFNEFTSLFSSDSAHAQLGGIFGNQATRSIEGAIYGQFNAVSYSIGGFTYDTSGFRANNDVRHGIGNVLVQYSRPGLSIQAEHRERVTQNGDLAFNFDPNNFSSDNRRRLQESMSRLGTRWSTSSRSAVMLSFLQVRREESQKISFPDLRIEPFQHDKGYQPEFQYMMNEERYSITAGTGISRFDLNSTTALDFSPEPCPFESCIDKAVVKQKQETYYVYANFLPVPQVVWTLGAAYEVYNEPNFISQRRLNPKFGMRWAVSDNLRFRVAAFETVKRALVAEQTLEPTQVAGFNQFYDDLNGTQTRRIGIGVDAVVGSKTSMGLEVSRRNLRKPKFVFEDVVTEDQRERLLKAYVYLRPTKHWSISTEIERDEFRRTDQGEGDVVPIDLRTDALTAQARYFSPAGFFVGFGGSYVDQRVTRLPVYSDISGRSRFAVANALFGFELPKRRGSLTVEGRNLFNKRFRYQDDSFRTSEPQQDFVRFVPKRSIWLRFDIRL